MLGWLWDCSLDLTTSSMRFWWSVWESFGAVLFPRSSAFLRGLPGVMETPLGCYSTGCYSGSCTLYTSPYPILTLFLLSISPVLGKLVRAFRKRYALPMSFCPGEVEKYHPRYRSIWLHLWIVKQVGILEGLLSVRGDDDYEISCALAVVRSGLGHFVEYELY